jgi:hypothetical protein
MPVLFIGHGNPMNAIRDTPFLIPSSLPCERQMRRWFSVGDMATLLPSEWLNSIPPARMDPRIHTQTVMNE